ncbi:bifunctional adenosylcobinamide kinase/adenosylcobinamide-phosphate guanylyltransferase [Acinetobacter sp. ANC 3791]|uniref:bifunctional adenosylcobinamide kinase/adenosylcobinamide-phosphate guanylyltransferase n=1 Tax=Acinetobacter sp. ANC 3791 TaxID=2529836 RepID=UPI00103EBA64|nr:bifunctional adenosylcobinamide kinase/adenosylcobinamide-phosphate guanylyltransferase [Acinetobacter sp. ANC 3791]TCB83198.1 bifunctional adenosylcobinamide kinase/adenosylcobinamide-phosphate guanylyltransferase [Acinetobacter sp. ANC 3791]
MLHLVLGGARSGKSHYAEQLALATQKPRVYIATAQAVDQEMQERIHQHQQQRDQNWQLVEEPIYLAERLQELDAEHQVILIDCLTVWMSNLLCAQDPDLQSRECLKLLELLPNLKSEIILVSNETGLGVVPLGEITRRFVDESGRLHQALGQICQHAVFCVAGFPIQLKGVEK